MTVVNVAASVRARLLNKARESKRPFQELLQYYALERFLFRLSVSPHKEQFVLKGALMLRVWDAPMMRPTKDIDLLGTVDNDIRTLENIVRTVCDESVQDDGIRFDAASVVGMEIQEKLKYNGVRIKFDGTLDKAKVPMQIDVGYGDAVFPPPLMSEYPTILEFQAPNMPMYPPETVVAEKFETMVDKGVLNSRMKDFYDVWLLSKKFPFDGERLAVAIDQTFKARSTPRNSSPLVFQESFAQDENVTKQWAAFRKRGMQEDTPESIVTVIEGIRAFLLPLVTALENQEVFRGDWNPETGWSG